MFSIEYTNSFKKDLKLMQKRKVPISEIKIVIDILASGKNIPEKYKNHKLKGNLSNKWDLHLQPDWVLLYTKDEENKIIKLVRTGTHSDLFH
jgi:mRNA interferase YafQ